MRSSTFRVKISNEAFEALSAIVEKNHSTAETVASKILNGVLEVIGQDQRETLDTEREMNSGKWGSSHGGSEAENPL